jgi:hypothetical protein
VDRAEVDVGFYTRKGNGASTKAREQNTKK